MSLRISKSDIVELLAENITGDSLLFLDTPEQVAKAFSNMIDPNCCKYVIVRKTLLTTAQEKQLEISCLHLRYVYIFSSTIHSVCLLNPDFALGGSALGILQEFLPTVLPNDCSGAVLQNILADNLYCLCTCDNSHLLHLEPLGAFTTRQRRKEFQTVSTIQQDKNGNVCIEKKLASGKMQHTEGLLTLKNTKQIWLTGFSIQQTITQNLLANKTLSEALAPAQRWLSDCQAQQSSDHANALPGNRIDAIWQNAFINDKNAVEYIDQEWEYAKPVSLSVLLIRSIFILFVKEQESSAFKRMLQEHNLAALIRSWAATLGVTVIKQDFADFIELESYLQSTSLRKNRSKLALSLYLRLYHPKAYQRIRCFIALFR